MGPTPARLAPDTMSVAEAAKRLGVHPDTVYSRISSREWPCTRIGRKIRISEVDLADIINICRVEPKAGATERGA